MRNRCRRHPCYADDENGEAFCPCQLEGLIYWEKEGVVLVKSPRVLVDKTGNGNDLSRVVVSRQPTPEIWIESDGEEEGVN